MSSKDQTITSEAPTDAVSSEDKPAHDAPKVTYSSPAKEYGGRGGLEPTRFGDWEIGGIASDF